MKHISKILVPTDFSPSSSRAYSYAIWFADQLGAEIELMHVVYPGTDVMDFPSMAAQVTQVQIETAQQVMKAFTNEALTRVQSAISLKKVPQVHPRIEVGTPVSLISSTAAELNAELIIVGNRSEHSGFEKAFGSVTTGVMSRSSLPVLVVPSDLTHFQLKAVGYATSLDESDPYHVLKASELLQSFSPSYFVVHVRTKDDEKKKVHFDTLETFLKSKNFGQKISFHEIDDDRIEEGLESFVAENHIDLLIMYSPKRNIFERLGHRSITRKMALFNQVPLLILKD